MNGFLHDLKQAVRLLIKTPGFSLAAIATSGAWDWNEHRDFSVVNTVTNDARIPLLRRHVCSAE
jgi:hypothetical protein